MSLLFDWLGIGKEIDEVPKTVEKQLFLIEELLEDLLKTKQVNRKERTAMLERLLPLELKIATKGHALEQELEEQLEKAKSAKKPDLQLLAFLHSLKRDLSGDKLWTDLIFLLAQEQKAIGDHDEDKLQGTLEELRKIASILKELNKSRFNETHMHMGMSVSADLHWKYLKQYWKEALTGEVPDKTNIIKIYENYLLEGKIHKADCNAIVRIMTDCLTGDLSEAEAFLEFEQLIIMQDAHKGGFKGFDCKTQILNAIQDATKSGERERWTYLLDCLENAARHNLAHGITHIELRFPTTITDGPEFWADLCKALEQKCEGKLTLRMVEMLFKGSPLAPFIEKYSALPKSKQKYFVAVDISGAIAQGDMEEIRLLNSSCPLPLCVHAGENWSQKDYPQRTPAENVEWALDMIDNCLLCTRLHRIGHANILGLDIPKYLKGTPKNAIDKLVQKQAELVGKVKERGIFIEANPTSNIMIRGITYEEHPIITFDANNIPFAISTDDRVTLDTNLKKEFYRIARALNWNVSDIQRATEMQKQAMLK